MTRPGIACLAAVVLATSVAPGCNGARQVPADDLMPPDGFLGSWQSSDERRTFTTESLYDHIDGGAELFLELGFDRVEVQHYTAGEAEVAVEVYLMRDSPAALGIYGMPYIAPIVAMNGTVAALFIVAARRPPPPGSQFLSRWLTAAMGLGLLAIALGEAWRPPGG